MEAREVRLVRKTRDYLGEIVWKRMVSLFSSSLRRCTMTIGMRMSHLHRHHLEGRQQKTMTLVAMVEGTRSVERALTNEVSEFSTIDATILVAVSSSESRVSTAESRTTEGSTTAR